MSEHSWRPRASVMGAYHMCERRAMYDKHIHDGVDESWGEHGSSGYADLGTLIHWNTQRDLHCVFPPDTKSLKEEQAEYDAQVANASTLFKGDFKATFRAIAEAAAMAAKSMPAAPDGKPWLAEPAFETDFLTGHIDFLSQDMSTIIDLKTTSRKPDHNRIKPPHLVQLLMYYLLAERKPKQGYILYVDSMKASWSILSQPVEFDNPFIQDYVNALREKIEWLRAIGPKDQVTPRPGNHCDSDFCPYKAGCRDRLIPPAGLTKFNESVDELPRTLKVEL